MIYAAKEYYIVLINIEEETCHVKEGPFRTLEEAIDGLEDLANDWKYRIATRYINLEV